MMLGFLLARAGIDVVVLEKHADFLRDFRGDTVHPSTMQVMHELGLLDAFLARPHSEVRTLAGADRRGTVPGRRLHPPADAGEVRRVHAAMGFPRFPRRSGEALSDVPAADADRGHRPDPRRRPHGRRDGARPGRCAGDRRRTDHRRRRPALHACATPPVSRSSIAARRWMCCGCACRSRRTIPARRLAAWTPAASSSCWTATTTGNARLSFPRAASTRCTRAGWRRSAPRSRGWRRTCATACRNSRHGTM